MSSEFLVMKRIRDDEKVCEEIRCRQDLYNTPIVLSSLSNDDAGFTIQGNDPVRHGRTQYTDMSANDTRRILNQL